MKRVTASVPGKIHLIGEHTVVYGYPAIIAATSQRVTATLIERKDKKIFVTSKGLGILSETDFLTLQKKYKKARLSWNNFIKTKDVSTLVSISRDPDDYVLLGIFEALNFYKIKNLVSGFDLDIDSEIPIGAGSGSSAAIATVVASCITGFLSKDLDKKNIFKIALATEELKHGTPSGGDPAAVLNGGLTLFQKNETRSIHSLSLNTKSAIFRDLYTVDTGRPSETTGEMIDIVRVYKESNRKEAEEVFDAQKKLTHKMVQSLTSGSEAEFVEILKKAQKNLEIMGVVSDHTKKIVQEIEGLGGAAKISGGGGKEKGSGMLIVYAKNSQAIQSALGKYEARLNRLEIGQEGLRVE